jgi:hypothetical protein
MISKSVGRLLWEKAFINIGLAMHGQIIFKLIIISLVSGLILKIVL